jgi:hypothetical protein
VSAPYILKAGLAPSWIEWPIKGSGGEAQAWQAMGYISGLLGTRELLRWGAERYQISVLQRVSDWLSLLLVAGMGVLGVGFVVLLGSLFLGVAIAPLSNIVPERIGFYLRGLDREPGAFILSGAIAALMAGTGVVVYFRTRSIRAEGASTDDVVAEAFASLAPFFFLTMIALNAFVGFGMLLIGPTHWFPGKWSSWIDYHSAPIVGTATLLSVIAPFLLHRWRLWRNSDADNKPRFFQACWTVFWISLSIGAFFSIALMIVIGFANA